MPVEEELLREKVTFLQTAHVWPLTTRLNADGWLGNFKEKEKKLGLNLLNSFIYLNEDVVNQLLRASIQKLSPHARRNGIEWSSFIDDSLFTYVPAEEAGPVNSGNVMLRRCRDILGIKSTQLQNPRSALDQSLTANRNLIYVDDFIGTGKQFIEHWKKLQTSDGRLAWHLCRDGRLKASYCVLVSTDEGRDAILSECPGVNIVSSHFIDDNYKLAGPRSNFWQPNIKDEMIKGIREVSARAGILEGRPPDEWMGFGRLGLALSFSHGTPDCTLPIFTHRSDRPRWIPLVGAI
jgi:hypothetical protein